jgi:hypothetical protein
MVLPFADRAVAGQLLARRLAQEKLPGPLVVVALPRGGVPVGAEVARLLKAPLDLVIVRKIGAPWQRELAVAAVVDGPHPEIVVDEATRAATGADPACIEREAAAGWRDRTSPAGLPAWPCAGIHRGAPRRSPRLVAGRTWTGVGGQPGPGRPAPGQAAPAGPVARSSWPTSSPSDTSPLNTKPSDS